MKTRIVLILITLVCATIASVQSTRAATITVTNTNDSGPGSLRQALILSGLWLSGTGTCSTKDRISLIVRR